MAEVIAVIVPTIPGREESLERMLASYADYRVYVAPDSSSAGAGWQEGVQGWFNHYGEPDYVHLTNDDCELQGDLSAAVEAVDAGKLPCPVVYNPDGSVQSAGGQLGAADDLNREIGPDWGEVGFTTIPFMSWDQWLEVGMLDIHYCSDCWISYRGRQLGYETVLRHDYRITHHTESVGRGAGMSQPERARQDRAVFEEAIGG